MQKSYKKLFLLVIFTIVTTTIFAQTGGGPPDISPGPPVGVPVDGGLGFLVVSGLVYATFKLKSKK